MYLLGQILLQLEIRRLPWPRNECGRATNQRLNYHLAVVLLNGRRVVSDCTE